MQQWFTVRFYSTVFQCRELLDSCENVGLPFVLQREVLEEPDICQMKLLSVWPIFRYPLKPYDKYLKTNDPSVSGEHLGMAY